MNQLSQIQIIAAAIIPVLFAITVHEAAHGWLANKFGDPTARMLGRLTFNPIKHIDPIGTIVVPGVLILMYITTGGGGFIFGWAKPVPITPQNFKNPKSDMALVALAGPVSNLLMAIFWAICIAVSIQLQTSMPEAAIALAAMGQIGLFFNLILMVLNLIPIPPLDGSRVLYSFLKGRAAYNYYRLEPYGVYIVLGLLLLGILGRIIIPIVLTLQTLILDIFI